MLLFCFFFSQKAPVDPESLFIIFDFPGSYKGVKGAGLSGPKGSGQSGGLSGPKGAGQSGGLSGAKGAGTGGAAPAF